MQENEEKLVLKKATRPGKYSESRNSVKVERAKKNSRRKENWKTVIENWHV